MSSSSSSSSKLLSKILNPQDTILKIVEKAEDVSVIEEGITQMAWDVLIYLDKAFQNEKFEEATSKFTRYSSDLYPDYDDNRSADWIFILHTLNFSLWSPKGTDPWTVDGYTGFLALCAAVKRAINEGKPIWNPKYYKDLLYNSNDVEIIFRSDNNTCIPILNKRVKLLHVIGIIMLKKYKGTFATCLKLCKNMENLLNLLIKNFPSYRENMLQYDGIQVNLCVKAAILVTDVLCFFYNHKVFKIEPTFQSSAMLIDFRSIQVFLKYKALHYSDQLKKKIQENDTFEFESAENLEIIACSYMIRNKLRFKVEELFEKYKTKNVKKKIAVENLPLFNLHILIDNFLWDYRHANLMKDELLHNVRSLYY